jgi:hypothetical protein
VYGPSRWGWLDHGTWLRPPIVVCGAILRPPKANMHLVEGHTRLGALFGYMREGVIDPASMHETWLGHGREFPK